MWMWNLVTSPDAGKLGWNPCGAHPKVAVVGRNVGLWQVEQLSTPHGRGPVQPENIVADQARWLPLGHWDDALTL